MKHITRYRYAIGGAILGAVAVFIVSSVTTEKKLSQLQLSLDTSIEAARDDVFSLVADVESGGEASKAAAIIADCTPEERDVFEAYLVKLDLGLSRSELLELDRLFSRCAPVQSVRRTLVVMDLSRRLEHFDALVLQRKQVGSYATYDSELDQLKSLVSLEEDVTELSFDMVVLQRQIIDLLLAGESVDSEQALKFKVDGMALRTELNQKASAARQLRVQLRET